MQTKRSYNRQYMIKVRRQRKEIVIAAYGGKCYRCSEMRLYALTIDHIQQGVGRTHRQQLGTKSFYDWLISNDFPTDYRVACWNCNWLAYLDHLSIIGVSDHPRARESRRRKWRQKEKVLELLGNKCQQCDNADKRVLTIHHINNDGAAHRRNSSVARHNMWRVVLRASDRTPYECRCRNCNSMEIGSV